MKKSLMFAIIAGTIITCGAFAVDGDKRTTSQPYVYNRIQEETQIKIPAANPSNTNIGDTVITYTNVDGGGVIGERELFIGGTYDADNDSGKLITAGALNNTFANLPTTDTTKLVCANQSDGCTLWTITDQTAYGETITLPAGYTRLNGVTNVGQTSIATGIRPRVDDVEWELRVKPSVGSWYILQARNNTPAIWGISGSTNGNTILLGWNGNQSLVQSSITRNATHTYYVKATVKNGVATLYVKDETDNTEDTKTATYTFDATQLPASPLYLYANGNPQYVASGNKVSMARIKVGGVTVADYVPALNSSNVVGFYDRVTGNFMVPSVGTLSEN